MLRKEKKHEQFPPYSLYRPLQGGLRKSRVLNHPVGLKSSRENLKLRFRPRENVDVFRVRSAPDALLHALWKERSTLSSVSGLNLHLHVFKKKKKPLGLPSSPRGFIPSLFDYEVKNLILLLLLLSSPQYILHPPPLPTLSSPRMADSKRLFCFFIRLKASTIRFTVVVYGFGWLCVLAASCALWRRRQGFTHEWRIPKSRQQRDVDTN